MTDRYADLRAALDAGPASGEWISRKGGRFMNMDGWSAAHEDHTFSAAAPIKAGGEVIAIVVDGRDEFNQEMAELKANADYIAAANPDTIRALLAERDALQSQDREDAERYRRLRKGDIDNVAVVRGLGAMDYGASAVIATYSEEIDGEELDAAIDHARHIEGEA